ncbi:eps1p [Saccharomyces arboricola H-6]|uniref:Eps1p n=1 Tax=Saccharomyces arboricola (strain H-6 / AS 2.3317 / CBS 10644) TaxID=1160507 RepID=J8Q3P9_SACAR|nr:eps1p [Saccharomyces arboricola H-6]
MTTQLGKRLLSLLACIILLATIALAATEPPMGFPEPLTSKNFKEELSNGLHIIDFYSPYCPHCRQLAPIWMETWEEFKEESKELNVTFSQVNCVESADLCSDEKIERFPDVRLYNPSGYIKSFSENPKTKDSLIAFARRESKNPDNLDADLDSSIKQSEHIKGFDFLELIAGKATTPYLVSFWPAKDLKNGDDTVDFENCNKCHEFQRTWKLISKQLSAEDIKTGHLNCEFNPTVCKELGFGDLVKITNHRGDREPKVALVLPNKTSNSLIDYPKGCSAEPNGYIDFAKRTFANSKFPNITEEELRRKVNKNIEFLQEKRPVSNNDIHLVFTYDPKTVVTEDFDILEYLIEPLSKIPNIYLHQIDKNLIDLSRGVFESMYEKINYNTSEAQKHFNEEYFTMNTVSQLPTFFMFKDGDFVSHVYHGYSTTEMRNIEQIMRWVQRYSTPLVSEVTSSNLKDLLSFQTEDYSNLAIQLVSSGNDKQIRGSNTLINSLLLASWDYEHIRMENNFELINEKRTKKADGIKLLREKKAPADKVVDKMRVEIPHLDHSKLLLGYLDIAKEKNFFKRFGITGDHKVGDVIIIDKSNNYYFTKDNFGNTLTSNKLHLLREAFVSLNIPSKALYASKLKGRLINSPFHNAVSFLDVVHQNGIYGYLLIIVVIITIAKGPSSYRRYKIRKHYKAKRNAVGILGNTEKKKNQD